MADMYGISNAVMEANSLHGQIALEAQNQANAFGIEKEKFNRKIRDAQSKDKQENFIEGGENLGELHSLYQVGSGLYGGVSSAVAGAGQAYTNTRTGFTAARQGLTGADFLAESGAAMRGEQQGAGILRSVASGTLGAAKGFVSGLNEAGGEAEGLVKSTLGGGEGLGGLEGIVQKGIVKFGGGEALGFVGAKAFGAAGGLEAAGAQIDSLIESGGKSAFTRVNDQGQRVAMSGVDKASEIINEAGAAADVLSAATGGLAVPIAAALNLAGAITGIIGDYKDEKEDDKNVGIGPDGNPDASKAPKLSAPPTTEAFTGLGFVGNMSHNPLEHIA